MVDGARIALYYINIHSYGDTLVAKNIQEEF